MPGLSSAVLTAIAQLPKVTDAEECAICMDSLATGGPASEIPCGHKFHIACLETWASEHTSCPCCRAEVTEKACEEKLYSVALEESESAARQQQEDALDALMRFNRERQEIEHAVRMSVAAMAPALPRRSHDDDLALATALSASYVQPRPQPWSCAGGARRYPRTRLAATSPA